MYLRFKPIQFRRFAIKIDIFIVNDKLKCFSSMADFSLFCSIYIGASEVPPTGKLTYSPGQLKTFRMQRYSYGNEARLRYYRSG
jgi:hypothetical protein